MSKSYAEHLSRALEGEGGPDKSDNRHLQSLLVEHNSPRVAFDTLRKRLQIPHNQQLQKADRDGLQVANRKSFWNRTYFCPFLDIFI